MGREPPSIDAAVERLIAAYRGAGLPPVRRAGDMDAILSEIRAEISPLRLPEELERFWRLVDPASITVAPYPGPTHSRLRALQLEVAPGRVPGMTPRLLFPVCYESHGFLFVELEDGLGSGGACIEWAYAGSPFSVRFPSLSACVDPLATMIEAVCTYGPAHTRQSEFDVVVQPNPAGPPDLRPEQREVQQHALTHDLEAARAPAASLHDKAFGTPMAAEATAIRPMD